MNKIYIEILEKILNKSIDNTCYTSKELIKKQLKKKIKWRILKNNTVINKFLDVTARILTYPPKNHELLNRYSNDYFNEITNTILFCGYPRSGSTLVGSILDSHENIVISHELDLISFLEKGYNKNEIYNLIINNSKVFYRVGREWSGYSYKFENLCQGRFKDLKIIGDKKAATTTIKLYKNRELFKKLKKDFSNIKFIHVVRNPFDIISRMILKSSKKSKNLFDLVISEFNLLVNGVIFIRNNVEKENFITIYHEDIISSPKKEIEKLISLLKVKSDKRILEYAKPIIFMRPRKTRLKLNWTNNYIDKVNKIINRVDFLQRYNFYN